MYFFFCFILLKHQQLVIVLAIRIHALTTKLLIIKVFRLTLMVDLMVAVFVNIVNTTLKASIAINVNRNSIGRGESTGTKQMCADVRRYK